MTAISSNRADKKAEKLLEREIARKKRKLQKTTAFDVFNIIFLLILAFIVIVPFYYTIVRSFLTQQEFIMNGRARLQATTATSSSARACCARSSTPCCTR